MLSETKKFKFILGSSSPRRLELLKQINCYPNEIFKPEINENNYQIFDSLVGYAIKYFNDVIKTQKKYKTPDEKEKKALQSLIQTLDKCNDEMSPEDIQTLIYSTGKENGYSENLRDWFKLIYQVVFGDENGPRMGFFISFFGVKETKDLILNKIK